jgi:hypothetical protein
MSRYLFTPKYTPADIVFIMLGSYLAGAGYVWQGFLLVLCGLAAATFIESAVRRAPPTEATDGLAGGGKGPNPIEGDGK